MGWTVDTTGVDDFEGLDEGGKCDPGIHLAELIDTYTDDDKGDQVFKFNVQSLPSRGSKLYYRLYDPELGTTPEKQASRRKQCLAIMKRLGVLTEKDLNNPGFEPNWMSAVGKKFVVEVIHEEWPEGSGKTTAKITMYGIMDLQSTHVKAVDRRRLGLPVLPEQLEAEQAAANAAAQSGGGPKPRKPSGGRAAGGAANGKHAVGAGVGGDGGAIDTSDL